MHYVSQNIEANDSCPGVSMIQPRNLTEFPKQLTSIKIHKLRYKLAWRNLFLHKNLCKLMGKCLKSVNIKSYT